MKAKVYGLWDTNHNVVKIGYTKNEILDRVRSLNTGRPSELELIDYVETEFAPELEAYLHRHFQSKRVTGGGGREFFDISKGEFVSELNNSSRIVEEIKQKSARIESLSSTKFTLEKPQDPNQLTDSLIAEILEIKEKISELTSQKDILELDLKSIIAESEGIRNQVTWKFQESKRIDSKRLKEELPDIAEKYSNTGLSRVLRYK